MVPQHNLQGELVFVSIAEQDSDLLCSFVGGCVVHGLVLTASLELSMSSCWGKYAGREIVARAAFSSTRITAIVSQVTRTLCIKA